MDYAEMNPGEFHHTLAKADASEWAKAFRQMNPQSNIDDGVMLGWFANCYMAGFDNASGTGPLCGDHDGQSGRGRRTARRRCR